MKGSNMSVASPLKWHGGKHYLAPWIASHLPDPSEYVHFGETHFGGGQLFCHLSDEILENHSVFVNDLNGDLINFWQVLQNEELFQQFQRLVESIPFSEKAFENARNHIRAIDADWNGMVMPPYEAVCKSAAFFVLNRQSRQGLMKDFATMSRTRTRRGMNEQVSSWLTAIEGLPEIHARLKRVVIFNKDAVDLIKQQDGPKTLFYCDPPYLHKTRVTTNDYQYEMDDIKHHILLETLGNIKGKFILSGYHSKPYDATANLYGWRCVEKQIDNKASSKKTKDIKTECLWMNF